LEHPCWVWWWCMKRSP